MCMVSVNRVLTSTHMWGIPFLAPALFIRMSMFPPNNSLAFSVAALVASGSPRSTERTLSA